MKRKIDDMVGKQYGRFKVLEITSEKKCLCQCSCGTMKKVNPYNILAGKSKSCGCLNRKIAQEKRLNLEGMTFGNLMVKSYAGHQKGRVAWNCECSCGNSCVVTTHELRGNKTKSCGCLKKKSKSFRDVSNEQFGALLVLDMSEERDYKGSVIWICKCLNCGKTVKLSEDSLVHGNYKSCGCLKSFQGERLHDYLHFYEGTCLEFLQRKKRKDNSSGAVGVYKINEHRYRASITFQKKVYNLGSYATFEEAKRVRNEAEQQLFQRFSDCYRTWLESGKKSSMQPFSFEVRRIGNQFYVDTNMTEGDLT